MASNAVSDPVVMSKSSDVDPWPCVPFVLTELHEVISIILSYLPAKSINTCARVCQRWNTIAKRLKKKRRTLNSLLYITSQTEHTVEDQLGNRVQNVYTEPETAIIYCSHDLYDSNLRVPSSSSAASARHPRAAKHEKVSVPDYFKRILPPSCINSGVVADRIIATCPKTNKVKELEGEDALTACLLPNMPGVEIFSFIQGVGIDEKLNNFKVSENTPEPDLKVMEEITGIPPDKKARLVLFFHTDDLHSLNSDIGYAILKQYDGKVVIAGAQIETFIPQYKPLEKQTHENFTDMQEAVVHGLAFCGDDLQVASILIPAHIHTIEGVEKYMLTLKDTHISQEKAFAFIFICIGRGRHLYNKENVEVDAFRKYFPNIPVYGVFGNGEIGYDFLPDFSKPEEAKDYTVKGRYEEEELSVVWDFPEMTHAYSTAVVVVSPQCPS